MGDPRDLQYLIKELQVDIHEECEEHIKGLLYAAFKKKIMGAAVRGFPEWYKSELAKDVFAILDDRSGKDVNEEWQGTPEERA